MSKRLAWILVAAGYVSLVAGVGLIYIPLAPIVGGALLGTLGLLGGNK